MLRRRLALLGLPAALFRPARSGASEVEDHEDLKVRLERAERQVRELAKAFESFKKADTGREESISNLSRTSPPVGTVTAFAGVWEPTDAKGRKWTEAELGWLLCDGRPIPGREYEELRAVLGRNELPDHRGSFLRGVDRGMDGSTTERDKEGVRAVGSGQMSATARPSVPFTTDTRGEHTHDVLLEMNASRDVKRDINQTVANQPDRISPHRTSSDGKHEHTITGGGDPETRPVNVAVYWIVKYK